MWCNSLLYNLEIVLNLETCNTLFFLIVRISMICNLASIFWQILMTLCIKLRFKNLVNMVEKRKNYSGVFCDIEFDVIIKIIKYQKFCKNLLFILLSKLKIISMQKKLFQ